MTIHIKVKYTENSSDKKKIYGKVPVFEIDSNEYRPNLNNNNHLILYTESTEDVSVNFIIEKDTNNPFYFSSIENNTETSIITPSSDTFLHTLKVDTTYYFYGINNDITDDNNIQLEGTIRFTNNPNQATNPIDYVNRNAYTYMAMLNDKMYAVIEDMLNYLDFYKVTSERIGLFNMNLFIKNPTFYLLNSFERQIGKDGTGGKEFTTIYEIENNDFYKKIMYILDKSITDNLSDTQVISNVLYCYTIEIITAFNIKDGSTDNDFIYQSGGTNLIDLFVQSLPVNGGLYTSNNIITPVSYLLLLALINGTTSNSVFFSSDASGFAQTLTNIVDNLDNYNPSNRTVANLLKEYKNTKTKTKTFNINFIINLLNSVL